MLDEVLERLVRHLGLISPVCITEDALQQLRVGGLDGRVGAQQCPADIA